MGDDERHSLIGGRYRAGAPLGEGGNGYVFAAVDAKTGGTVAIKRMHGADRRSLHRIRREAALLRSLDVRGVVRLIDAGEDAEGPYLVLERVEGDPFPGPVVGAARIVALSRVVLGILEEMHRSGVVHRDVKPGNVLVDEAGRVTLVDFGLARTPGEDGVTEPGAVVGTFDYIAPEVWDGTPGGPAADLFALGVMTLKVLGGDGVPVEAIPAWRVRAARGGLAALAMELPGIPDDFRPTLARLLAPDPAARLVSVGVAPRTTAVVHLDDARPRRLVVADPAAAAVVAARQLRALGFAVVVLGPGEGPGASLVAAGWTPPSGGSAATAAALASAWLEERVGAGAVLVVAGSPDRWSARRLAGLPAIRLVSGVGRRLDRRALRGRFGGEDRLLPTAERAADTLLATTAGIAPLVDAQLDLWARLGLVQEGPDGLVPAAAGLRRAAAGLDAGAEVVLPLPPLERPAQDLLAALVLARPGAGIDALAAAVGRPTWAVEASLAELARAGLAHRSADGWRDLAGGAAVGFLGEGRRRVVEEKLLLALPASHPAAWRHGLLYADAAAVVRVGVQRADVLLAAGDTLGATAVLADAVLCAGAEPDVDFTALVLRVVDLALRAESLPELRRVRAILHYLPCAPRRSVDGDAAPFAETVTAGFPIEGIPLLRLVDAAEAALDGHHARARRWLDDLGPLPDPTWESWRRGVGVRAAIAARDLDAADAWASRPLPGDAPPDARARMAGLAGLVAYNRLDFAAAARCHLAAAQLRDAPDLRLSSQLNAASALLEAGEARRCAAIARAALAEARRHHLPLYAGRAAWLERRAAYASGRPDAPDQRLVDAVVQHTLPGLLPLVALQEAAFAWRDGAPGAAVPLAARVLSAGPSPAVTLLARGILAAAGAEPDPAGLFEAALAASPPFRAQVIELLAEGGHAPAVAAREGVWDDVPAWRRDRWLEVTWGGPGGRPGVTRRSG